MAGPELLLDTCVYIDVLQGRTPLAVDDLLCPRLLNHSTICLAELTYAFGRLDPQHAGTRRSLATIAAVIADIPAHRLLQPSRQAMGEASILAGMVSRLTDQAKNEHPALLNDAIIYLQAVEQGQVVLTRNLCDFDLPDQLRLGGRGQLYQLDDNYVVWTAARY